MSSIKQIAGLFVLAAVSFAAPTFAQGWIEPVRPVPGGGVEKVRSAVQVTVRGRAAQVTVEEWFRNTGAVMNEGSYLYPLPGEAVFSNFSLWQGDQELRGETMDANQARAIYEAIVRQRKDPALIELAGHGMIRARVFPINPGETRKITLRYTQMLDRAGDAWRFRYVSGPGAGPGQGAVPRSFRLAVDSAGRFGEPFSPTHRVTTRRDGDRIEVTLADQTWSGDLELLLPLTRGLVGMSLLTHQPAGEDGFFMLLLAPGARQMEGKTQRRDIVAVMDVSGSMSGEKMEQAKAALVQLLGTLREGDRFRVIAFSSGVRRFAEGWTRADPDGRRQAQEWVRALGADGGTNIAGALTEAFAQAPAEGALGVVVFLTDGLPSVGESDPERIAEQAERARGQFRVFAFGIGHDVNTYLLDRLTVRARGSAEYVPPGGDIERVVGAFATKVATPVLTDLALSAGGGGSVELYDLQPGSLPDLFSGDEMVVFGRYRGAGSGTFGVTVTGRRNGEREQFVTTGAAGVGTEYITQLWASRKAGALAREIRLRGANPEIVNELRQLALRYGILTEYTAYLVQEPGMVATRPVPDQMMNLRSAAPSAQSGAGAIARAEEQAKSANVATAADASEMDVTLRGRSGIAPTQRVANRLFVLRDGVWTDLRHADSVRLVTVEPYSEAYFALLRALPELVKPAALTPAVVVAGSRASIKFQAGGKTTWATSELERIVREFRS